MKNSIGEVICQYRQMRKMTQEEFASRLGVTAQAVSKWERGNGLPDVSYIVSGLETDYVNKKRLQLVKKTGKLMPVLRIRDNTELKENEYRISAFDNILLTAVVDKNTEDPYKKIIDDVADVCDKHYSLILNKNIVKLMMDNLAELYPGVVEDIVPSKISYLQIKEELKKRVEEGKSIRNLMGILEDMEMKV